MRGHISVTYSSAGAGSQPDTLQLFSLIKHSSNTSCDTKRDREIFESKKTRWRSGYKVNAPGNEYLK